ncbi:hypothetical protein HOLleu_07884 [Holothuria leucospilota]|uniref:Uncharacterized protein n=1 Tax=Holothuria leucospilota TaxID=206669 RepID=A0A9Q1CGN0_HOLLE|nr:hypothetical protein HOLleu_07884 [Holothuria leucospilota]
MLMEKHVNSLCRSCYAQMTNIGRIRPLLNAEATKSLVHSLGTSRLEYCNFLLCGAAGSLTSKLQRTQNAASRLITRTGKCDHITLSAERASLVASKILSNVQSTQVGSSSSSSFGIR